MTKLRIGFDGRCLGSARAGIGNYLQCLLAELANSYRGRYEFIVFSDRPIEALPSGIESVVVSGSLGRPSPLSRFYSVYWMNFLLPRQLERYETVLFHSPNHLLPVSYRGLGVVTVHDLAFWQFPRAYHPLYPMYMRTFLRGTVRRAKAIITVSEATKQDLLKFLPASSNKVWVVHNGVDPRFKPAMNFSQLKDCVRRNRLPEEYLLYVGTIERRKNLQVLIRAFARACVRWNMPDLVLAGKDGTGAGEIRRFAVTIGVSSRVHFAGYIPSVDLPALYSGARAFVYPSLYEGFGLPVVEAMACGTPVLASSVPALAEVAGDAAMLVDPCDEGRMAECLYAVAYDEQKRERLRASGFLRARAFSWSAAAAEVARVYKHVLDNA